MLSGFELYPRWVPLTLRGFTLIENRNKNCNSILSANMQFSESLSREVNLNMIYNSSQTGRNVHYN